MRYICFLLFLSIFNVNYVFAYDQEPSVSYILEVEGKRFDLTLDTQTEILIDNISHKAILTKVPYRLFSKDGVSFKFPENYIYSFEEPNKNTKTWKLTSTSNSVMVHKFDLEIDCATLLNHFVAEFKKQFAGLKIVETKKDFVTLNNNLSGINLKIYTGDIELVEDIYSFKTNTGPFIIMVQDSRETHGKEGRDYLAILALIKSTLNIK